ncbi:Type I restriction modification DNA specificity domain-containing protein, partial [Pilibacter termitis]
MEKFFWKMSYVGYADAWEQRRLGEKTKLITKGTTPKDKSGNGSINFVKVENIINGKILPVSRVNSDEHENYLKRSKLEENDILFSIAGTLGRTATVDKSILPANTNQALAIIRGYDFDTNFLITSLSGKVVKDFIRRNPTVGAQPNLSLEQVGNLVIHRPKIEEQIKIGAFFSALDHLITLHQRKPR